MQTHADLEIDCKTNWNLEQPTWNSALNSGSPEVEHGIRIRNQSGSRLTRHPSSIPVPFFSKAFISFSIVALLFLVTQELLTEAQSVANGSAVINVT